MAKNMENEISEFIMYTFGSSKPFKGCCGIKQFKLICGYSITLLLGTPLLPNNSVRIREVSFGEREN